jgi:hypothetical protein
VAAAGEGPQTIRLNFDSPQNLSRITLVFEEHEIARTQEFVLSWKPAGADDWRELRRQQFNFSPPGTTTEWEEVQHIPGAVSGLEVRITPSMAGGGKHRWHGSSWNRLSSVSNSFGSSGLCAREGVGLQGQIPPCCCLADSFSLVQGPRHRRPLYVSENILCQQKRKSARHPTILRGTRALSKRRF